MEEQINMEKNNKAKASPSIGKKKRKVDRSKSKSPNEPTTAMENASGMDMEDKSDPLRKSGLKY